MLLSPARRYSDINSKEHFHKQASNEGFHPTLPTRIGGGGGRRERESEADNSRGVEDAAQANDGGFRALAGEARESRPPVFTGPVRVPQVTCCWRALQS